jgi:thiol-disulfide isomerase/thioredoxin
MRYKIKLVAVASVAMIAISSSPSIAATSKSVTQKSLLTFTAKTVDGKAFTSKILLGKKPSVLWFWAPWCAICHNESVDLVKAAADYAGRVNFVGVGALGTSAEMRKFVSDTGVGVFSNIDDSSGKVWKRFGVVLQPTLILISSNGKITTHIGPSDADYLNAQLKALTAS